jgi:two-component system, sensor histidine kinase and response regulator
MRTELYKKREAFAKGPRRSSPAKFRSIKRVLIADDSMVNQQVAANMVAKIGYQSDLVANGAEAIKAVENGSYALVLMDCQMPEVDGFEATKAIRALTFPKGEIPIIALTANALPEYAQKCFSAGMDDVIVKPVVLKDLRDAFQRWLAEEAEGGAPAEAAIDRSVIQEFYSGLPPNDPDTATFVNGLIDMFLEIVPGMIESILAAAGASNSREMGRFAHKLKGTSLNLGARQMVLTCEALEKMADAKQLDTAKELALRLKDQFEAAKNDLLSNHKSSSSKLAI